VTAYTGNGTAQKRKIQACPTCGGPLHRDPVTKRYTRHPDSLPAPNDPGPIEVGPVPRRKRGLFRRKRT
jgi:hypothetical protein